MGIGQSLSEILKKQHIRPSVLADSIGVPRSTISSIISRDNTKIDIEILFKICDALNVSTDEILGYKKNTGVLLTKSEEELVLAYRKSFHRGAVRKILDVPENEFENKYTDFEHINEQEKLSNIYAETDDEERLLAGFRKLTPEDGLIEIGRIEKTVEDYSAEEKEEAS